MSSIRNHWKGRWSDALSSRGDQPASGGESFGSRMVDSRSVRVASPPALAQEIVAHAAETARYLGLLAVGAGLRRGRGDPNSLPPGDSVDCWRVEAYEPDRLLRLFAEMRLPGRAWLQFEVEGDGDGSSVRQTSNFDPVGLPGILYWYGLYPIHTLVFAGMLRGIARAATRESDREREHVAS